jgi:ubiquinone/menaquinone biosynthesis C-methylase UbiE
MLGIARRRATALGMPAELRLGDAQALEFPDECFDSVVCTLSLCTIPDDGAAVAEIRRVLRPGRRFVFLEHVRSTRRGVRRAQRQLDPLFMRSAAGSSSARRGAASAGVVQFGTGWPTGP